MNVCIQSNAVDELDIDGVSMYPPHKREKITYYKDWIEHAFGIQNFCKGVSKKYVISSLNECDIFILMHKADTMHLLGFTTLFLKDTSMHVDVICTNPMYKGVGRTLMECIFKIKEELKRAYIDLCSLQTVSDFYRKLGFMEDAAIDCTSMGSSLVPMRKYGGTRKRSHRKRRLIRSKKK